MLSWAPPSALLQRNRLATDNRLNPRAYRKQLCFILGSRCAKPDTIVVGSVRNVIGCTPRIPVMELHHIRLIGFAAGVVIVGLQTFLIARQWRAARGSDRRRVLECGLFCLVTALWQFGNLADEAALALNLAPGSGVFKTTFFIRRTALDLIPLSLSYLSPLFAGDPRGHEWLSRFGRWL